MMRTLVLRIGACLALTSAASATSIAEWPEERILDALAQAANVAFYCQADLTVQHDVVDLVWDVYQLRTGHDPDSRAVQEVFVPRVQRFEELARADGAAFCHDAEASFGTNGYEIAAMVGRPQVNGSLFHRLPTD